MPASTAIASGTYELDTARSTIGVSHKAMWGLATVTGAFTPQSGDAGIREGATASGTVTIDAGSLNTANAKRDEHLRSDRFFDTVNHPTISITVGGATLGPGRQERLRLRAAHHPRRHPLAEAHRDHRRNNARGRHADHAVRGGPHPIRLNWNWAGMLRGPATMTATLIFTRP